MSSSTIRPPGMYPAYWHDCLHWLTSRKDGDWISLSDGLDEGEVNTAHTRARSMTASIRTYPAWPSNIRLMVADGILGYRKEFNGVNWSLIAYRKQKMLRTAEILKNIDLGVDNSD